MNKSINLENAEKPFKILLGFGKLIEKIEEMAQRGSVIEQKLAHSVLSSLKHKQALKVGIEQISDISRYEEDIDALLDLIFPAPLLQNEIKIAVAPMSPKILRCSTRYRNTFKNDEALISSELRDIGADAFYIQMCTFILQTQYGVDLKATIPPVYSVTNERGIVRYYKSGYNADFMSMRPYGERPVITKEILQELEQDYNNVSRWKEIFPPNSWEITGFGIMNFTDVSNEEALSLIKNNLIGDRALTDRENFENEMSSYLSTLMDVPDVWSAFTLYDKNKKVFIKPGPMKSSYAMSDLESCSCEGMLCGWGQDMIFNQKTSFLMSDVDAASPDVFDVPMYARMRDQGVKSFIITPIYDDEQLLGIMEFVSKIPEAFRNKHLLKIEQMLGLSATAIKKFTDELENEKSVIIQNEFTSIHPSVEWKFMEEAENFISARADGQEYNFDNITFHELTALYGQMDIAGSSKARNKAIAADLQTQMTHVRNIISAICKKVDMPLLESIQYQITIIYEKLSSDLAAGMEQEVVEFLKKSINPLFEQMRHRDEELELLIAEYFTHVEDGMDIIYNERKNYDDSVKMINMHLSSRLDQSQQEAQRIYPHYFERYKTDGVEHNIFIGQEIAPQLPYHKLYLDNLRLWQLKMICHLEMEHNEKKKKLPLPLDVASLVMVYSNPIAIKYRMDEKQFDVDGAYNARYEIIKKRIDKAHIKGTNERITQPGKIVIIYTQPSDLDEYTNYINFLTYEGYLKGDPETFEIEQLQGVVGLRGIRVAVNYDKVKEQTEEQDSMKEAIIKVSGDPLMN